MDKVKAAGAVLLYCILSGMLGFGSASVISSRRGDSNVQYRRGELPTGIPVIVYWIEDDGRITAESAIRTDYAGVVPFSTTGRPVRFDQMDGWFSWSELKPIAMEALR
jgi:hypothetical protein